MKILFLAADKSKNGHCNYYMDTLAIVARNHAVHCYGVGYAGHDPNDRIEDVLAKAAMPEDLERRIVAAQRGKFDDVD